MRARTFRALHRPIGTRPDTITIGTCDTLILMGLTPTGKGPGAGLWPTLQKVGYGSPTDTWLWLTYKHCMGLAHLKELVLALGLHLGLFTTILYRHCIWDTYRHRTRHIFYTGTGIWPTCRHWAFQTWRQWAIRH
jgi:hypothetical protein